MQANTDAALSYDNMNSVQTLYVRSPLGDYQTATDAQVLAAARVSAASLITDGVAMDQPQTVKGFFRAKLAGLGHECAAFLFLDSQFRVIQYLEPSQGTLTQASVYPRDRKNRLAPECRRHHHGAQPPLGIGASQHG
jgi:DNA repair protein RadC